MKLIRSLAFGAMAIMAATFSSAASAKADNVGVYVGSDGFGLQISSRDRGYYGGGYYGPANYYHGGYRDRCRNKHYRRTHRHCWNGANNYYGGYNYGYQPNHYYGYGHRPRGHHAHGHGHRDWGNQHHWRDRRDGRHGRDGWRSRGHDGRNWNDGGRGRGHHGGRH